MAQTLSLLFRTHTQMLCHELSQFQIFNGLSENDSNFVCQSILTREYKLGETILNEGQSVQALWIIVEGKCVVTRSHEDDSRVLAMLSDGDVFGEMSFVRDAPHSASIEALSEVKVCIYKKSDFLKLGVERPRAAFQMTSNIAAVLAERLRRMDTWVCDIMNRGIQSDERSEWESFRSAVYTNWSF